MDMLYGIALQSPPVHATQLSHTKHAGSMKLTCLRTTFDQKEIVKTTEDAHAVKDGEKRRI